MREILFRGKDVYGNWLYGDLINLTDEIKQICNHTVNIIVTFSRININKCSVDVKNQTFYHIQLLFNVSFASSISCLRY